MQERRNRRRCDRCRRQPGIERAECGFDTETEKCEYIDQKQHICPITDRGRIQRAAKDELVRCPVVDDKDQRDERKCSTAQGIVQVFPGCQDRFPGQGMHDQRNRNDR